jgi:hypothetical protein
VERTDHVLLHPSIVGNSVLVSAPLMSRCPCYCRGPQYAATKWRPVSRSGMIGAKVPWRAAGGGSHHQGPRGGGAPLSGTGPLPAEKRPPAASRAKPSNSVLAGRLRQHEWGLVAAGASGVARRLLVWQAVWLVAGLVEGCRGGCCRFVGCEFRCVVDEEWVHMSTSQCAPQCGVVVPHAAHLKLTPDLGRHVDPADVPQNDRGSTVASRHHLTHQVAFRPIQPRPTALLRWHLTLEMLKQVPQLPCPCVCKETSNSLLGCTRFCKVTHLVQRRPVRRGSLAGAGTSTGRHHCMQHRLPSCRPLRRSGSCRDWTAGRFLSRPASWRVSAVPCVVMHTRRTHNEKSTSLNTSRAGAIIGGAAMLTCSAAECESSVHIQAWR